MKTTKTVWHWFDIAAFDEELGRLNEMSRQGWQLVKLRQFSQTYRRNRRVVYRYAMDLQESMSQYEMEQYRAEFGEQGWEYVTGREQWHIFRKRYDPALPETAYRLYTDEPSFREMKESAPRMLEIHRGWAVGWIVVLLLFWIYDTVVSPSLFRILLAAGLLVILVCNILRCCHFRRVTPEPKPYRFHFWRYSFLYFLVFCTLAIAAGCVRVEDARLSGPAAGRQSVELAVKLPDFYGLYTLVTDGEPSAPVYSLTNEDGETVKTGFLRLDGRSVNLFLPAGHYTLTVDWDAAAFPGAVREREAEATVRLGSCSRVSLENLQRIDIIVILVFFGLQMLWIADTNRRRRRPRV